MITRESIKLAEIVTFEDRTQAGDLIISRLSINEKYKKVLAVGETVIDLETGKEIKEMPSVYSGSARLFTEYYSGIADLTYVLDEDINKAIDAYNIYLNEKENEKIVDITSYRQRKRHF